jgi:hypothetical protein
MNNNKHTQVVDFSNPNADKITSASTQAPMTNNKQETAVEWYIERILDLDYEYAKGLITLGVWSERKKSLIDQAKAMQQGQAQLYATFVLTCVNNNLPPITFNDWINLDNK